jgi:hypothetical protein
MNWTIAFLLPLACAGNLFFQGVLDAQRERVALQVFLKSVEKRVVSAAEAMPADKYGFVPAEGAFQGVRTFGQQVKHLAAANYILAAAALGKEPPAGAGDETGPKTVRTKAEILAYLSASFGELGTAIAAIGRREHARSALTHLTLVRAFDHAAGALGGGSASRLGPLRANGGVLTTKRCRAAVIRSLHA